MAIHRFSSNRRSVLKPEHIKYVPLSLFALFKGQTFVAIMLTILLMLIPTITTGLLDNTKDPEVVPLAVIEETRESPSLDSLAKPKEDSTVEEVSPEPDNEVPTRTVYAILKQRQQKETKALVEKIEPFKHATTPLISSDSELHSSPSQQAQDVAPQPEQHASLSKQLGIRTFFNDFPEIVKATIKCDDALVRKLIDRGVDPNTTDEVGDPVLIWAIKRRCLPVVKLLVERGVDVNKPSSNGLTPYVWARMYRTKEIRDFLVQKGAEVSGGSYWWHNEADGQRQWLQQLEKTLCPNKKDCE